MRSKGEGSIYRSPDGAGWAVSLELPRDSQGKRRRMKRRAKTKAEAQRILAEMRQHHLSTGRVPDRTRLIGETLTDYLLLRESEGAAESTLARDRRFVDLAANYFGRLRTESISVADIDAFLADIGRGAVVKGGKSVRSPSGRDHLRRLRNLLRGAFNNDERRGLISTNPAKLAVLPSTTGKSIDKDALELNELSALLDVASGVERLLIDFIGRHGLRPAEARAVQWNGVDLRRGTVRIHQQMSATNSIVEAKTARSNRVIPLHPQMVSQLSERISEVNGSDLVCATSTGNPVDRNNFVRSLRRLCDEAGIRRVAPYELRHTAITHQCQRGFHAWQVADWAGTSERMIYLHYRHVIHEVIDLPPLDWTEGE